jgi:hypothetical protein
MVKMYQNRKQSLASQSAVSSHVQQSYTIQHDFTGPASITTTLTHALSDISGIDVTDAEHALEEYVDPDALDRLFAPTSDGSRRANGQLMFNIDGYRTTIYGNGLISIVPPQQYQR